MFIVADIRTSLRSARAWTKPRNTPSKKSPWICLSCTSSTTTTLYWLRVGSVDNWRSNRPVANQRWFFIRISKQKRKSRTMIIWREKHTFCQEQNSRSQSFAAFKSNLLIEKVTCKKFAFCYILNHSHRAPPKINTDNCKFSWEGHRFKYWPFSLVHSMLTAHRHTEKNISGLLQFLPRPVC